MLYTIESNAGVYVSEHPAGHGYSIAHVYHQALPALQNLRQLPGHTAKVSCIDDLKPWLETLMSHGVTHVTDHVMPAQSETWRVTDLLRWLETPSVSE